MNLRSPSAFPLLVAVAALWAGAATASATVATFPEGAIYEDTIKAESGSIAFDAPAFTVSCESSTVEATVVEQGESVPLSATVSTLDFSGCNYPVTVLKAGTLSFEHTSGGSGTVRSTGAELTVDGPGGLSCLYKTSSTDIGTLTGSSETLSSAVVDVSGTVPRTGHSFFCGSSAVWTGSYTLTTPSTLTLDAAPPADLAGQFVTTGFAKGIRTATENTTDRLEFKVDGFGLGIVCDKSTWVDNREGEKHWNLIFIVEFKECRTTGSVENFGIKTEGCGFGFSAAKDTTDKTEQTGWLVCKAGHQIEIMHPNCTIKIPDQNQELSGLTYKKITIVEKHALTADVKSRLRNIETKGTGCGAAEKVGWLEGSLLIEGFDPVTKKVVPLTVTNWELGP